MGETRRSARLRDPYVLVTAAALAVALAQSVSVKTPALPPLAPADAARGAPADRGDATDTPRPPGGRHISFAPYAGDGPFDPRGLSVWALVFGADDASVSPASTGCGARATAQAPAGSSSRESG